jgi:SM-20-related protein
MEKRYEDLIAGYIKNKIGISDHFLNDDLCEHLKNNLMFLNEKKLMQNAGIGNDTLKNHDYLIRRDSIYWLDKKHTNLYENEFLKKMDNLVIYLNQTCYTNIKSHEFHYSLFESGDFYRKHLDQFKDDSSRQFSIISYLNPNWEAKDGGELLVYQANNNQAISPTQGKTVFFKSSELEHEVLVTQQPRMSITGWLKR